ncbi:MAG: pitrilysin family protein [Rhodobacteraceae bacterium]|nr:pitrilysin family protein [Paracoccaceae bacterium]
MTAELTILPNGLRVATDHMPGLRTAAIAIHIRAGARHETERQNGIAHFLEHMAFKGTNTRTSLQIAEEIEDVGGFLNAFTGREATVYLAAVLDEDVPLAVEMLADIVQNSVFEHNEMELERSVILNEIGEIEDSPTDVVFDALQLTAYPGQSYGRPIIGSGERVAAFRRKDILQFVDRHYRPERMILSAAGAVRHDELAKQAEKLFTCAALPGSDKSPSCRFVGGECRRPKPVEQAQFALAFESPALMHKRQAAARIYGVLLGGGSSSRLFTEAREKRGLCYSISAHSSPGSDTGIFILHASTGERELPDLAFLCAREIRRSAAGLTDKEIDRAKTQIRVGILMGHESPANRIERMATMLALTDRIVPIEETIERYDCVAREDVEQFAAELVGRDNAAMAVCGPVDNAPPLEALLARMSN